MECFEENLPGLLFPRLSKILSLYNKTVRLQMFLITWTDVQQIKVGSASKRNKPTDSFLKYNFRLKFLSSKHCWNSHYILRVYRKHYVELIRISTPGV